MKFLTIIGSYIKTHIITSAVIGTVVVGGAIATPIIVNNINDNQNKTEVKEEKHEEEVGTTTCEDGYELVDNECMEIKQEEPRENDTNDTNTNTSTSVKNPNHEGENTNTNTNTSTNKTNNNQTNDPQETKPSCNDISCKITESNRIVYYDGKMLFGFKKFQTTMQGYQDDGWQYNSSLIQSLSKEDRNYILNNYFKKSTYCSTNQFTSSNCLEYSVFEHYMENNPINTAKGEVSYYELEIEAVLLCPAYMQNGDMPYGYTEELLDSACHQGGNNKWNLNDVENHLNECRAAVKFYNHVAKEAEAYLQAYRTTRSLLQQ